MVAKCVRILSFCHLTLYTPLRLTLLLLQPAVQSKSEACVYVVYGKLTDALMRALPVQFNELRIHTLKPLPASSVLSQRGVTLFWLSRQYYILYPVYLGFIPVYEINISSHR